MQSSYSRRNRIVTGFAGTAIAAGALFGALTATATASAEPFDPSTLPSCLEFVNPDGTVKGQMQACKPVDIYSQGLTLAQRKAFVNTQSPNHDRIIADLEAKFDEAGNPKNGGYPVKPWDK